MAIIQENNSLEELTSFSPIRCDTHFKHNIKLAHNFFSNEKIKWISLGEVIEKMQNGMNVKTEYYSMDKTDIYYLSVSQIKEHGLIEKNQNYLTDDVRNLGNFCELEPNMVLVTRSGTIGVAISTNHPSFDFDEKTYVASGFVITSKIKKGYCANTIANYINLFDVQRYLNAMASGACQKNIAQPTIAKLPIPEILLTGDTGFKELFEGYGKESRDILLEIEKHEKQLEDLKLNISSAINKRMSNFGN